MAQSYNPSLITQNLAFCGDPAVKSVGGAGSRLYDQANVDSASVKLLIHGNEGSGQSFTDSSLSNHTITAVGNTTHSTAQSKFSGGSIKFDGTGDYLSVPDSSDWAFGTEDFTIDFWFYPSNIAPYTGLIVQNPGGSPFGNQDSSNGLFIEIDNNSSKLRLFIRDGSDMFTEINQSNITQYTWHHVAVVRETGSNKITMYLNGSSVGSSTWSGSESYPDYASPMLIGVRNDQDDYFDGYMDEVRITKGAALWTQDFTPPARRDTLSISDGMMYNGSCVNFDGTDEQVYTGDGPGVGFGALSVDDDVTLCAWINVDTTGDMGIISIGNVYMSIIVNGGYLEARCYDSGSQLTNTDAHKITPNQWCHVAGVFSGGNVTLYKDGVATAAVACSNEAIAAAAGYFQIGKGYTSGYLWMDGEIASPMAFDTALSASQIKEIYQDSKVIIPSNVSQTNLRGWWTFADGAGTICYDGSGRGIYGEFQNMESADWSTGQTGCPQLITGYNKPMLFASSKYVEIPQNSALDIGTSDFTFAAWTFLKTGSQPNIAMQFAGAGGWRMVGASGKVRFSVFDNGWSNYASMDISPALTLNQWNHVAVSVNRDGNAQSYINGVAKTSLNVSGVTGTLTNAYPLRFGAGSYTSGAPTGDYIDGTINEAVLYDKALSASEIEALASRITLGESLNSSVLITNSSYPMTWLSGASTTGVAGESDGVGLDAFNTTDSLVFVEGQRYRLSYNGNIIAGSGLEFAIVDQVAWTVTKTGFGSIVTKNGANVKEWVSTQSGTFVAVWYCNAASCKFVVSDFSIVPIGEPSPPDAMAMGDDVAGQISAKSTNADESTYSYGGTTYKTWTYRSGGTFVVPRDIEVDVVVVGGGGGGGYNVGGGGGAGGLVSETLVAAPGTYTVTVGAGGLGRHASMSPAQCTSGGDSSVDFAAHSRAWPYAAITTTAVGGGRGGGYITSWSDGPQSGGSGGGGRHSQGGAAGTAGQGNAGGSGTSSGGQYAGAGGGGAGAVGANAVFSSPNITAGDGGNGKNDFINSSAAETAALLAAALPTVGGGYLAGGGGGSRQGAGTTGAGGLGGGGKGSYYSTADGENGQVNTGGGGGGEMDGGSGVVIIRYAMPSPIGYWRNDGASTWTDLSGNGNNGTAVGSPSSLLFKQGYTASKSTDAGRDNQGFPLKYKDVGAIGFNGVNDYIEISSDLLGTGNISISSWVNVVGQGENGYGRIVDNGECQLYYHGGLKRFVLTRDDSTQAHTGDDSWPAANFGKWVYVVATSTSAGVTDLYINGVLSGTANQSAGTPVAGGNTIVGNRADGARTFDGQIANTQIYNRALIQTEIKQNFAAQANRFQVDRGIIKSSLIRWLDFGNTTCYPGGAIGVGSGMSSVKDLKTGTEYGILNTGGGITYSSVGGGCFDFAGTTDDKIPFTATANLSACTVSVWVYNISGGDARQTLFGHYFEIATERLQMYSYGFSNLGWRFSTSGSVPYNTWTNAVMTWDGSNVKAYINGALNYTNTVGAGGTAGGFYEISVNWARLKAKLATGLIYDRALSAAELKHNFDVQRVRFGK